MNSKIDVAWSIFKNQQEIIKFFDQKINALLFVSSLISSYILLNAEEIVLKGNIGKVLIYGYLLFFVLFIVFSVLTILPRNPLKFGKSAKKLIYFKDISSRVEPKDYVDEFKDSTEDDIETDLCYQIYELGTIAKLKSVHYTKSWRLIIIKLSFFLICAIYQNIV